MWFNTIVLKSAFKIIRKHLINKILHGTLKDTFEYLLEVGLVKSANILFDANPNNKAQFEALAQEIKEHITQDFALKILRNNMNDPAKFAQIEKIIEADKI